MDSSACPRGGEISKASAAPARGTSHGAQEVANLRIGEDLWPGQRPLSPRERGERFRLRQKRRGREFMVIDVSAEGGLPCGNVKNRVATIPRSDKYSFSCARGNAFLVSFDRERDGREDDS